MFANNVLLLMNPSRVNVVHQGTQDIQINNDRNQMGTRNAHQIELPAIAFPMVKLNQKSTNKLLPIFLCDQESYFIDSFFLTVFGLRVVPNQDIHETTLYFVLKEVYIGRVMLNDACIDHRYLVDLAVKNLFDFDQFVKQSACVNSVHSGCPSPLQHLLPKHCRYCVSCELQWNSTTAIKSLLQQKLLQNRLSASKESFYFNNKHVKNFFIKLLHETAHQIQDLLARLHLFEDGLQVFNNMNPREKMIKFHISLLLNFFQGFSQRFDFVCDDRERRSTQACCVEKKLKQFLKILNTFPCHYGHTEQNQPQILVLTIKVHNCVFVTVWCGFSQNLIVYLDIDCLSILEETVFHGISAQINENSLAILGDSSNAVSFVSQSGQNLVFCVVGPIQLIHYIEGLPARKVKCLHPFPDSLIIFVFLSGKIHNKLIYFLSLCLLGVFGLFVIVQVFKADYLKEWASEFLQEKDP